MSDEKHEPYFMADGTEVRKWAASWGYRADFGRTSIRFECPFCGDHLTGYIWSLAGSGKKCTCGVLHGTGRSYKRPPKVKK